jgi:hypothetical protein
MAEPAPALYRPRPARALGVWELGGMRLKVYHIGPAAPDAGRLEDVRAEAARIGPAARAEGEDHGLGFVVIHDGEVGTWLLLDWWAHGDILCQRLSLDDGGGFASVDDRPLTACVWELPFLAHERDAWVRHMMTGAPDPAAYLADLRPGASV